MSVPLIIILSILLPILTNISELIYLSLPALGLAFFCSTKLSKSVTIVNLDNKEFLLINKKQIDYLNILGYFEDITGGTQNAISLRLVENESIHIVASSIGKEGKHFKEFRELLISEIKLKNPEIRELEYQDVHVNQIKVLRPFLIGMSGIVIFADIFTIYGILTGHVFLPWQFFFMNVILISLIPYMKKKNN